MLPSMVDLLAPVATLRGHFTSWQLCKVLFTSWATHTMLWTIMLVLSDTLQLWSEFIKQHACCLSICLPSISLGGTVFLQLRCALDGIYWVYTVWMLGTTSHTHKCDVLSV